MGLEADLDWANIRGSTFGSPTIAGVPVTAPINADTPNLSGKVEYLYITAASFEVSRHSEVRAGLNYRFGGM